MRFDPVNHADDCPNGIDDFGNNCNCWRDETLNPPVLSNGNASWIKEMANQESKGGDYVGQAQVEAEAETLSVRPETGAPVSEAQERQS